MLPLPCDWQVLQDYVALVDDAELRIALAQKHKCHDIVINVRTLGGVVFSSVIGGSFS